MWVALTAHCTSCVTFGVGRHCYWPRPNTGRKLNQWMAPLLSGHLVIKSLSDGNMWSCTSVNKLSSPSLNLEQSLLFILHPKNKSLTSHIPCPISGFYCVQKPSVGFIPGIFVQIHFDYFCGHRWHVGRVILTKDWIKVESLFLSSLFYWIWFSSLNINKTHKKGLILLIAIKDHSNFWR